MIVNRVPFKALFLPQKVSQKLKKKTIVIKPIDLPFPSKSKVTTKLLIIVMLNFVVDFHFFPLTTIHNLSNFDF